jgi:hypothetical protein
VQEADVSANIPSWIKAPVKVLADGDSRIPARLIDGQLHFTADEVSDVRCFLVLPR